MDKPHGFAALHPERRRELAAQGGKASHVGLAALPPERRKEIARLGGRASRRGGFAAMSPERLKATGSRGGRTTQKRGRGHRWNRKEASEAGYKGAMARWKKEEEPL